MNVKITQQCEFLPMIMIIHAWYGSQYKGHCPTVDNPYLFDPLLARLGEKAQKRPVLSLKILLPAAMELT